jgi:GntR family transcriptional regulator
VGPNRIQQPDLRNGDRSEEPLYQRIRRSIRDEIATGEKRPGDRLPSESNLAESFGTTRMTVRQALSALVYEGVINRQNGRGSFVADSVIRAPIDSRHCLTFEDQMALAGRTVTYGQALFTQIVIPPHEAKKLQLPEGNEGFLMERVRLVDDRPVCLEQRYMPNAIGLHVTGEMLANQAAHSFVGDILGESLPTIVVSITAEIATGDVARRLALAEGAPVMVRSNTHHDRSGKPVICGRSVYVGDVPTDYVLGQPLA